MIVQNNIKHINTIGLAAAAKAAAAANPLVEGFDIMLYSLSKSLSITKSKTNHKITFFSKVNGDELWPF